LDLLPLKDLNRTLTAPHINRVLILLNIVAFAVYFLSSEDILLSRRVATSFEANFVMVPILILNGQRLFTLVTSMFMHANLLHLAGNMLYLYIFGDNIEDVFGHVGYLAFYLFSGLAASFTHILSITNPADLVVGVVGASGAISGVLGAYLILFPRSRILSLVAYFVLPVPAVLFLGFWFALQWIYVLTGTSSGVAYFAHIGGFITGVVLAVLFGLRRKDALRRRYGL